MENGDENLFDNESIFQSAKDFSENYIQKDVLDTQNPHAGGFMSKLISKISSKISEYEDKVSFEKLKNEVVKTLEKEADILALLMKFGCKLNYISKTNMEIECEQFNLKGHINLKAEKEEDIFDENALEIIKRITYKVYSSNNLEEVINRLEGEGFYPVGELTEIEAMISDKQRKVLMGVFQNTAGETKKIYFYNGQEVFPKEEDNKK